MSKPKLGPLFLLLLVSCSTTGEDSGDPLEVFSPRQQSQNAYYSWAKAQSPEVQARWRRSVWEFFLGSAPIFYKNLAAKARHQGALDLGLSPVLLWGESEPLHTAPSARDRLLEVKASPSSASRGPWYADVVRAESGAELLALSQSLRLYHPGACLEGYEAGRPGPWPFPKLEKNQASELRIFSEADAKAVEPALARAIRQKAEEEKLPLVVEIRKRGAGYVVSLGRQILELMPLEPSPTAVEKSLELKSAADTCGRFKSLTEAFALGASVCWSLDGQSFARTLRPLMDEVQATDINSEDQVYRILRPLCGFLAAGQARQWNASERATQRTLVQKNPVVRARLRAWASEDAQALWTAQRMLLQDEKLAH